MLNALEVFTTVVVGVMVGVEFSVAFVINPILNGLPEDSGVLGRAHGGRMLGALMPVWYITSLVLTAVWAVAGWHHHGTGLVVISRRAADPQRGHVASTARPDQQPGQDMDPREPARGLEGAAEPLGPLPLRPRRRHHRRLHPAGRRPRLSPRADTALVAHDPHSPGGSEPPNSRHPGMQLSQTAHNCDPDKLRPSMTCAALGSARGSSPTTNASGALSQRGGIHAA